MTKQTKFADTGVVPLLAIHAVPRTGSSEIPGAYDPRSSVWVTETEHGLRPIVESEAKLAELVTKTKVEAERDDVGNPALLETATKTSTVPERDDFTTHPLSSILELATKTEARKERDD